MAAVGDVLVRMYDIVVFGASGFTGQYVVEELARTADAETGVTWAVAGRSMAKLQRTLATATAVTGKDLSDVPVIVADVDSEKSLTTMCAQAKVILNCVGPYRLYGTPVVKACIEQQCHHIDICGEPEWLENMQLLFHKKAKEAGSYILESCGFDCIPCEMGMRFMKEQFNGDLCSVESYISLNTGPDGCHFNNGTWMSGIHSFANRGERKNIRSQLYTTPLPKSKHVMKERPPVFYRNDLGKWCIRFMGADKAIAYRTARFNLEERKERIVQLRPFFCLDSFFDLFLMMIAGIMVLVLIQFRLGIWLLSKYPGFFSLGFSGSDGPNRKQVMAASFKMKLFGRGYGTRIADLEKDHDDLPDKKIAIEVTGPEAGYITTPICAVQAAYVLLKEKDKLPDNGGVYTPGAAFADTTLLSRLQNHNLNFSVFKE